MSPVMLVAAIVEALDAEQKRNPGADLVRAKELVLQACEQLAWQETCDRTMEQVRIDWARLRMDGEEMMQAQEPAYEVRHG